MFTPANLAQKVFLEWLPIAIGSFLMTLLLRTYAFASFFIPTSSMADTIAVGDLVLSWNFSYQILGERPRRGNIITFDHPNPSRETWIKRVIALPGETMEINKGVLTVDGREIQEDYLKDRYVDYFGPLTVPEGCYFVLGDNRYDSSDSRYWGVLPEHKISGQAKLIYWPPEHARWIINSDSASRPTPGYISAAE